MTVQHSEAIRGVVGRCLQDPARFNRVVLGRGAYWSRQLEVCRSVTKYRTTCAYSGNGVGKSYLLAGLIAWAAACHPGSKTIVAAPTQGQLSGVVWAELTAAYNGSKVPLGGKLKGLSWQLGDNWSVEGYGSGSVESKSGRHACDLFAFVDEASGVSSQVLEAIDSLNPSRIVFMGNPLRPEGKFFELCTQNAGNPHVNAIHISSLEGPHAAFRRSPWGMADATWLEDMASQYGEDSLWWLVHVLGMFPGSSDDALIPRDWLDLVALIIHSAAGPRRIAVDLAKGNGGDQTVVLVRDDNGVTAIEHSNRWSLEEAADRTRVLQLDHGVASGRISYDATNLGTDFANRLAKVGIHGAKGFMGSHSGGDQFGTLRDACHWAMRRRLDPRRGRPRTQPPKFQARPQGAGVIQRTSLRDGLQSTAGAAPHGAPLFVDQPPFALGAEHMRLLRPELQALKYSLDEKGRIVLEPKDVMARRLRHSPDFADTLAQSFAFPYA